MLIGEAGAVSDLWEAARRKLPRPRLDRPGPTRVRDHRAAAGRRNGAAAGDRGRPRPARPLVCGGPSRGARRRPVAARPERLPLAHADPDRGGALVAVGRGRRDPVQGRGVRLDAGGGAAPAGLDRSARPQAGVRGAGAPRPDPAAARAARRPSASSCGPRTPPRSGSTSRSACTTCSTTAPCSCEDADPRAPRPRRRRTRGTSSTPFRRAAGCPRRASRRRGRSAACSPSEPIDLGVSSRLAAHAGDARARARRPRSRRRRRAAPRRDRIRLVRGRPARRVPRLGVGARARRRLPGRG